MKNRKQKIKAICFAAMLAPSDWTELEEQQQQAKSLGIRVPDAFDNPDSVDEAVLSPITPSGTLGNIVDSILKASADEMVICVDLDARKVHARPAAGVNAVALIEAAGADVVGALKQLVDARSSVFIDADNEAATVSVENNGASALERIAAKPELVSRNIASVVNAIDDDLASVAPVLAIAGGNVRLVVIDQHTALVSVLDAQTEEIAAIRALFNAGHALADESRYEQIPAAEASGATVLAFE